MTNGINKIDFEELENINLEGVQDLPEDKIENHIKAIAERASVGQLQQNLKIGISEQDLTKEELVILFVNKKMRAVKKLKLIIDKKPNDTNIDVKEEITLQEAADFLNVPCEYLMKILDNGEIPYVKTGCHRKVRVSDMNAYKQQRDKIRSNTLSNLAELDAELI